ncbi:MAG: hypothetical protein MJ170_03170, partial [Alphaproteobacteria bacterium]|nr:hypothetical protein [Alphaproteobacteria bacterium]
MFVSMDLCRRAVCCVFFGSLCCTIPAYCASSVRTLSGTVRVTEPEVVPVNTRASSLPVTKKQVSTSQVADTKIYSTQDTTTSSQRIPYGMHVSSISVPTFISSSSDTEFAGKDTAELEERLGVVENDIVTVTTHISDLQSETDNIIAALDEISGKFDDYVQTSDLAAYAKTSDVLVKSDLVAYAKTEDLKEYAKTSDVLVKSDLTAYAKTEDL